MHPPRVKVDVVDTEPQDLPLPQSAARAEVDHRAVPLGEATAARTAEPTPYGREVIVAAHQTGRRVAVVSNNSADSVHAYLHARRLIGYVHPVIGRPEAAPERMKPDPFPVLDAVRELRADPAECVLVGDSVSDIEAAHAAGVTAIGYANKPGKRERFAAAEAVIHSMAELVAAFAVDEL